MAIEDEGPHSFAVEIGRLCDGEANAAISDELHSLLRKLSAEAAASCKKVKGKLNIELVVTVDDRDVVGIAYSVKSKAPEPRRQTAVMWLTDGGNLSPENPRQTKLPLRDVNKRERARDAYENPAEQEG